MDIFKKPCPGFAFVKLIMCLLSDYQLSTTGAI
jgi:hypothetical protein